MLMVSDKQLACPPLRHPRLTSNSVYIKSRLLYNRIFLIKREKKMLLVYSIYPISSSNPKRFLYDSGEKKTYSVQTKMYYSIFLVIRVGNKAIDRIQLRVLL